MRLWGTPRSPWTCRNDVDADAYETALSRHGAADGMLHPWWVSRDVSLAWHGMGLRQRYRSGDRWVTLQRFDDLRCVILDARAGGPNDTTEVVTNARH